MNKTYTERIKKISIRGRMALGIHCIELYRLKHEIIKSSKVDTIISLLWAFVDGSMKLTLWEDKVMDIHPEIVLESVPLNEHSLFETLTKQELNDYYQFYKTSSLDLVKIVSRAIDIGESNLNGGTGEFSLDTFKSIISILEILEKNEIKLPFLNPFEKSKFSESGWGAPKPKSFFQ